VLGRASDQRKRRSEALLLSAVGDRLTVTVDDTVAVLSASSTRRLPASSRSTMRRHLQLHVAVLARLPAYLSASPPPCESGDSETQTSHAVSAWCQPGGHRGGAMSGGGAPGWERGRRPHRFEATHCPVLGWGRT
jgi:hypothetical protein